MQHEQPSILLVDDDTETLTVLRCVLEAQGYQVVMAPSGREALDRLAKSEPAMVLSDVRMPSMDGLTLCRTIRERMDTRVPVVLMSGQASERDRAEGFAAGASDFLGKPIRRDELLSRVRGYAERWSLARKVGRLESELSTERNGRPAVVPTSSPLTFTAREDRLRELFHNRPRRFEASVVHVEMRTVGESRDGDGQPLLERLASALGTLETIHRDRAGVHLLVFDGYGATFVCPPIGGEGAKHEAAAVAVALQLRDDLRGCFRSGIGARAELECAIGVASGAVTAGPVDVEQGRPAFVALGPAATLARNLAQLAAPNDILVAELCWVRSGHGRSKAEDAERVGPLRHPRLADPQYAYRPMRRERQVA